MLALDLYHDNYGRFPPPDVPNERLSPDRRLSWLVLVLPYLDERVLYNTINLEDAWDSSANHTAARTSVEVFMSPAARERTDAAGYALTHVAGATGWEDGRDGVFSRSTSVAEITDGLALTAIIGEVRSARGPWIAAGPSTVRPLRAGLNRDAATFGSEHEGGLHLGLADGSVRFVSEKTPTATVKALATIAAGDRIESDGF